MALRLIVCCQYGEEATRRREHGEKVLVSRLSTRYLMECGHHKALAVVHTFENVSSFGTGVTSPRNHRR